MMQYALQYLRMGFSVIPLRPKSKEPLIPWQEYQKRKPTEAEIRAWFTSHPRANIGLVTGAISNIAVIDLDGTDGLKSGQSLEVVSPATVITGKGKQLYYRHSGGNICNAVRKYPGVDVRGDGGYVVAPPSIHPNGKRYRWMNSAFHVGKLPLFPASIFAQAAAKCDSNDIRVLAGSATALEAMTNGNIDNTLFRVCSRLRG
jgi:hypothetical protein